MAGDSQKHTGRFDRSYRRVGTSRAENILYVRNLAAAFETSLAIREFDRYSSTALRAVGGWWSVAICGHNAARVPRGVALE